VREGNQSFTLAPGVTYQRMSLEGRLHRSSVLDPLYADRLHRRECTLNRIRRAALVGGSVKSNPIDIRFFCPSKAMW